MLVKFMILVSIISFSTIILVKTTDVTDSLCSSPHNVKDLILEWWKRNDESKPLSCNLKINTSYNNSFLVGIVVPEVKVITCSESMKNSSRLYFKGGGIKDGYLEGKGKLAYINDTQWKKLLPQKKKEIFEQNICLRAHNLDSKNVEEIIGTFKRGFLHGKAKVSYNDGSYSIASYRNGKVHGYQRMFGPNGTLVEAGVFDGGWPSGRFWKMESNSLIYYDRSMVVDDYKNSLVFPLTKEGKLKDPMAGDFNPHSSSLTNIHQALLKDILSDKLDCVLEIDYQLLEKETYSYSIFSHTKFSLFPDYNSLLCNIIQKNDSSTPALKLENWLSAIDETIDPIQNGFTDTGSIHSHKRAHEILWRLKPIKEDPNHNISLKLIHDINVDKENKNISAKILGSPPLQIRFLGGDVTLDNKNRPHGFNDLEVIVEDKHRIPKATSLGWAPRRITGFFRHGILNGIAGISTNRSNLVWATVKDGVLHGPTLSYGINFIMEHDKLPLVVQRQALSGTAYIGYFKNSYLHGTFWAGTWGGNPYGHLHGVINDINGKISGDDIAYIYPDMETALLGKFEDSLMKDAQESEVQSVECDENGLLYVNQFAIPDNSDPHFYYEPPSNVSFGGRTSRPGVLDPYERKWLELRSADEAKMGQGVFTKKDVKEGLFISSYTGFVFDGEQHEIYCRSCQDNLTKSDDERRHCKKYSLPINARGATIDIPPEYDQADSFLPSWGPKVNHHFRQNNSFYSQIEHPRWGATQSVTTKHDIKAGQELFTYYGYGVYPMPSDFPWYWDLKMKTEKQERLEAKKLKEAHAKDKTAKPKSKQKKKKRGDS